MIDPDATPNMVADTNEKFVHPKEAVATSNREVIEAIYRASHELPPDALVAETNGSRAYASHAGLIRLVYENERGARDTTDASVTNPAVEKLLALFADGTVVREALPGAVRGFKPEDDPLYQAIPKAWSPVCVFTDAKSGEIICYSVKTDSYSGAETVLVSPEHIDTEKVEALHSARQ